MNPEVRARKPMISKVDLRDIEAKANKEGTGARDQLDMSLMHSYPSHCVHYPGSYIRL